MNMNNIKIKKERLARDLSKFPSLLVAFSGGVDSSFLLAIAHQVLEKDLLAVTASSITHPSRELELALAFTRQRGIEHIVFQSEEILLPEFIANTRERCYHCKKFISKRLIELAEERNIKHVAHGANVDDLGDYRPGLRAAEEMGILSPLQDAGLCKKEIRNLSKEMGLDTWDKPAMACLASRIPYGSPITREKLKMVEEGELFLFQQGFYQVRVRHHDSLARIEIEESGMDLIIDKELRRKVVKKFRDIGFNHISVDLEGHVTGSMNRDLD